MINCALCHTTTKSGEPTFRVILKRRAKVYPPRSNCQPIAYNEYGEKIEGSEDDPGGKGWEIASEVQVCRACHGFSA